MTIEEAFIVSGACYFDKESLREMQSLKKKPLLEGTIESVGTRAVLRQLQSGHRPLSLYEHPRSDRTYIIGADCSEGVEDGDLMGAVCLDRERCAEVAWLSGSVDPDEASKLLFAMGQHYNWAWIGVEDNGPGLAVLTQLVALQYPRIYRRVDPTDPDQKPKLGHRTDARTRPLALGALRSMLKKRIWGCASDQFLKQCGTFVRHNDGGYRAASGAHDDDVMAASIVAFLQQRLPVDVSPAEQERESRMQGPGGTPMRHGHRTGY